MEKVDIHQYFDQKFNRDFKTLERELEDYFNDDYEKMDAILDRIPEMDGRDWEKKIKICSFVSTNKNLSKRRLS